MTNRSGTSLGCETRLRPPRESLRASAKTFAQSGWGQDQLWASPFLGERGKHLATPRSDEARRTSNNYDPRARLRFALGLPPDGLVGESFGTSLHYRSRCSPGGRFNLGAPRNGRPTTLGRTRSMALSCSFTCFSRRPLRDAVGVHDAATGKPYETGLGPVL
jgi:hypothetical protein